jgi:hypothetical protein
MTKSLHGHYSRVEAQDPSEKRRAGVLLTQVADLRLILGVGKIAITATTSDVMGRVLTFVYCFE